MMQSQAKQAMTGAILDGILAGMLLTSFIINCMTMGKPLREKEHKKTKKSDKKTYGRLSEDVKNLD